MQGYILNINKVRDEDLIVTILSTDSVYTTYRFYGARHSNINIGYKIDFELETNMKSTIARLKDVLQLNFAWILNNEKMYHWQRFLKLFYSHLKDVEEIDEFYMDLLNELVIKLEKQNTKRAILESYIKICEYEGRLHTHYECLLCDMPIQNEISVVRSFITTHPKCSCSRSFTLEKMDEFFTQKSLINFSDSEVETLWNILLQGL
ncbi:MAG TPA: recombination protein RecO [Arcobacter sp.]|nr:recombination protein RecO [Arcobacter sp.]